jgi:hypothetical protein
MNKHKIHILFLASSSLIALFLIVYFWFIYDFESQNLPTFVLVLALVYITIEMLKKNFLKIDFVWNRLYYIGLFAIIAPIAFSDKMSFETLRIINQLGILFLLAPVFIEGKQILKDKK